MRGIPGCLRQGLPLTGIKVREVIGLPRIIHILPIIGNDADMACLVILQVLYSLFQCTGFSQGTGAKEIGSKTAVALTCSAL